ncbi:uncharacterized protein K452DRAFT_322545 [Aplosporella prunicola CBS 121167]|uniref:Copper acquisition factor BIM1-like domain-containing protein n=1 Tax=Aplosporella prunicola CBS 121167 TaxID=1176127 RepID=A0A6A6AZ44_9PEZI|nr:uncharacterized protein K452DRAFT_322545 [Aplosporella prunicola CBS 121167]KAF2136225.1 hypothetical protein K452DRAFT_322545 [Aplosporella prunicola CBS 121167]
MIGFLLFFNLLTLVSAHFTIQYPTWRGDSFADGASQWIWPCANANQTLASEVNRTTWPLTGGSLRMHVSHPWALTYINLGLAVGSGGDNEATHSKRQATDGNGSDTLAANAVPSFDTSLLAVFNQTGNGTFCLPEVGRAALAGLEGVKDGVNATIQVIQIAHGGNALYNCADITFSSNATLLSGDDCVNTTNVGGYDVLAAEASSTISSNGTSPTATNSGAVATPGLMMLRGMAVVAAIGLAIGVGF